MKSTRSYEGSAAVFLMSLLAIVMAFSLSPALTFTPCAMFFIPAIALLSAVVEAISLHGWDNAIMQIVPAGFVWVLF